MSSCIHSTQLSVLFLLSLFRRFHLSQSSLVLLGRLDTFNFFSSPNKQGLLINAMALHWKRLGVFDLNGSLSNWHLQRICQFPSLPFSLPAFTQRPIKYFSGRGAHHRGMSQSQKGFFFYQISFQHYDFRVGVKTSSNEQWPLLFLAFITHKHHKSNLIVWKNL